MLKKLLFSFLVSVSLFAHDSSVYAMEGKEVIDPEEIIRKPQQTKNGKGRNYNSLGSFEEEFIKDCRIMEIPTESAEVGNILFEGEAFGRLPRRILREIPSGLSNIIVNELAPENIMSLVQNLVKMKNSSNKIDVQAASRVSCIVGDCLDLPENKKFMGLFCNHNPEGSVDLIMCSNVIHFFDGEQVLKFFINTFNFLKPNGRAYIFTQSRLPNVRRKDIVNSNPFPIYMKTTFGIMDAAKKDPTILFPGLINDEWLLKTPVLIQAMQKKPNGLCMTNYILEATLQLIAHTLGFEVVSQKFYCDVLNVPTQTIKMKRDPKGIHCGLILKKPKNYTGGRVTLETLDPAFVESCLTAKEKMETFIDTKLTFIDRYPFVEKKK